MASLIEAPVGRQEKPEAFYQLIEAYYPTVPKVELLCARGQARLGQLGAGVPGGDPALAGGPSGLRNET
jgi:hypothetical protein